MNVSQPAVSSSMTVSEQKSAGLMDWEVKSTG